MVSYTEEHNIFRRTFRRFLEKEIQPHRGFWKRKFNPTWRSGRKKDWYRLGFLPKWGNRGI